MADAYSAASLIAAQKVEGTPVFDTAGEKLGRIETLMLHKLSGKVAYALLSSGGVLGVGERRHPLPWSLLKFDIEREGYVIALSRAEIDEAPHYEPAELGEDDKSWGERVHAYYQVTPSWM